MKKEIGEYLEAFLSSLLNRLFLLVYSLKMMKLHIYFIVVEVGDS